MPSIRLVAAALAAGAALALVACGGDTEEKNDYVDAVNEVTSTLQTGLNEVSSQGTSTGAPADVSKLYQGLIDPITTYRTILGTVANPFSGWLLLRSLETVSVRMRRQAKSAMKLAEFLSAHPSVSAVHYPGLLREGDPQRSIYERQCKGAGSLIAFEMKGGQEAAVRTLNRFEVARLAVSLGGTETLVEHPMTMTHADVPPAELARLGVSGGLIRMSVGLEHLSDLKRDLEYALGDED